jgi:nitroreductase
VPSVDLIATRWSPNEFLSCAVEPQKLHALFEAARWAASCFNEQPWRFIVATKDDPAAFARVLGLLAERNQQWAKTASQREAAEAFIQSQRREGWIALPEPYDDGGFTGACLQGRRVCLVYRD